MPLFKELTVLHMHELILTLGTYFIVVKYTPQEIYSFISTSSGTKYFTELHDHCFCPRTASSQAYCVDRPQVQVFEDMLGESVGPGQKPEEPREAPAWPLGRLISSRASPTVYFL